MIGMAEKVDESLVLRLLEMIPEKGMSVHQISCKTSLDPRTIKKYVRLIVAVQAAPKVRTETVGLRVLVRREK